MPRAWLARDPLLPGPWFVSRTGPRGSQQGSGLHGDGLGLSRVPPIGRAIRQGPGQSGSVVGFGEVSCPTSWISVMFNAFGGIKHSVRLVIALVS